METTKEKRPAPRRRPGPGNGPARKKAAPKSGVPGGKPRSGSGGKPRTGGNARTAAPARRVRGMAPARHGAKKRTAPLRPKRFDPNRPRVVYTPPKPFSRSRLLLRLATVVAVVVAMVFGLSIFFKVENVTVSGAVKYDPWTVKEASGIEIGDNLLTFGESKASARIKIALPYVDTVRIGIKLPDTVNIEIVEYDVVYAVRDATEQWWMITSEGKVVEKTDNATAGNATQILGVKLGAPIPGQQAQAQEDPAPVQPQGTETAATTVIRASDRLATALEICRQLEACGILGQVASVDVSDLGSLELWYGSRFQVKLGDSSRLAYKLKCMDAAINGSDPNNSLKEYDSGMLDVSFTIKEDQLIYQGFTD